MFPSSDLYCLLTVQRYEEILLPQNQFRRLPPALRRLSSAADTYHLDDALHLILDRAKIQQFILIFSHTS